MLALLNWRTARLLAAALVVVIGAAAIYQLGRQSGESEALKRAEQTRKDVTRIENETRKSSDDQLVDWLTKPLGLFGIGDR